MRSTILALGAAVALCGALWLAKPGRAPAPLEPELARSETVAQPVAAPLEAHDAPEARATLATPPAAASAPAPATAPRTDPAAALRELAAEYAGPQWVAGARAHAAGLDTEAQSALARSAADAGTPPLERCAAAEILRHVPGAALPADGLSFLRASFAAREKEPQLALAAARALGAFGGPEERAQLLDAALESSSLASAGLACLRGDEAARELALIGRESQDARRAEHALAALASIAASDEGGLTPRARAECAAQLGSASGDAREARRQCALAALEAAPSAPR
jgi:hypothetical protein